MRTTAATSSTDDGRTATAARAGTSPASDQCIASGHQSRLRSATSCSSSITSVTCAARRSRRRARAPRRPARGVPVSSMGGVGSVIASPVASDGAPAEERPATACVAGERSERSHRVTAVLLGVGLLGGDELGVGAELAGGLGVVPAQLGRQQRGDVGCRGERAGRSNRCARVRRVSTSSSVVAISWRAAYTASARRYGRPATSGSPSAGSSATSAITSAASVP